MSKLVDEVSTASVEPDKPPDITSIPSDPLANIIESLGIGIFESDFEQVIAEVSQEETETSETQQCETISNVGEDMTSEIQQGENISLWGKTWPPRSSCARTFPP